MFHLAVNGSIKMQVKIRFEPGHTISYKMAHAPTDGSDQPAHPCIPIWAFVVRLIDKAPHLSY